MVKTATAKELRENRAKLVPQIRAMSDKLIAESRDFTAEEKPEWERLNKEYDAATRQLEIVSRTEQLEADQKATDERDREIGRDDRNAGRDRQGRQRRDQDSKRTDERTEELRALAFQGWARHQMGEPVGRRQAEACRELRFSPSSRRVTINLFRSEDQRRLLRDFRNTPRHVPPEDRCREFRAMSSLLGPSGGFTVPATMVRSLEVNMLAFGGVRQVAETIRTAGGEPMSWPTADDTSNTGEQIGENTAQTDNDGPTFGQVSWGAYKYSSKLIKVPFELLQDSAFNIAEVLGQMLGERLGRITNTRFTTGTGAVQPKGIVTAASLGKTAASATAIASDELFDLEHSIDPAYRGLGCGWMFHDNILLAIRKLKDSQNRYLWQPSLTMGLPNGTPDTLLGYPYTINQDMASSIATTNKTILFGLLRQYKIRTVGSLRMYRLTERFRDTDQDGFMALIREDGNLLIAGTAPIKYLQQA